MKKDSIKEILAIIEGTIISIAIILFIAVIMTNIIN